MGSAKDEPLSFLSYAKLAGSCDLPNAVLQLMTAINDCKQ
jgi:hypothetical protein